MMKRIVICLQLQGKLFSLPHSFLHSLIHLLACIEIIINHTTQEYNAILLFINVVTCVCRRMVHAKLIQVIHQSSWLLTAFLLSSFIRSVRDGFVVEELLQYARARVHYTPR